MKRSRLVIPLAVVLLWIAVPVEARTNRRSCPHGSACVYDETNFQGRRAQVPASGCIDSRIRSAVNATDRPLEFFAGGGCRGLRVGTLGPGDESPQISAGSATGDCSQGPVDPCSDEPPSAPSP